MQYREEKHARTFDQALSARFENSCVILIKLVCFETYFIVTLVDKLKKLLKP